MACFSIRLEKPLAAEKERSRHPRMGDAEPDATITHVIEILLIEEVNNIEPQEQFLIVPSQRDRVRH
jgi:hypothetical protein